MVIRTPRQNAASSAAARKPATKLSGKDTDPTRPTCPSRTSVLDSHRTYVPNAWEDVSAAVGATASRKGRGARPGRGGAPRTRGGSVAGRDRSAARPAATALERPGSREGTAA